MTQSNAPEVWLRGPLPGLNPFLQPVGHALLQAREEVNTALIDFSEKHLWDRLAGVASVGFHLQHLAGVLDRLFTYARGESLTPAQLEALALEGKSSESAPNGEALIEKFNQQVDRALEQLCATSGETLLEPRGVGRGQLPSTVLGLLFHAAEHTQRHVGQLLVTAKVAGGNYEL
ncbi:MAG: DinB family protein [Cytophagaceae bacterium]|nr:DinB family protein [Cytophagaceae bacterium]